MFSVVSVLHANDRWNKESFSRDQQDSTHFCTAFTLFRFGFYVSNFFPHIVFQLDANFCTAPNSKLLRFNFASKFGCSYFVNSILISGSLKPFFAFLVVRHSAKHSWSFRNFLSNASAAEKRIAILQISAKVCEKLPQSNNLMTQNSVVIAGNPTLILPDIGVSRDSVKFP